MPYVRPAYRPPAAPRPHQHRLPRLVYWRRRAVVLISLAVVAFIAYLVITLIFALLNPSYGRVCRPGHPSGVDNMVWRAS